MMERTKLDKAASYARRLCNIRARSEKELRGRLFMKGFGRASIDNVISLLKENSVIDDFKFAKLWVESRMHINPKGDIVLRKELRDKGVASTIIDKVLSEKEGKEDSIVRTLAKERLETLKNLPKEKAKKKLFDFLARRGFNFDVIKDVISEEIC